MVKAERYMLLAKKFSESSPVINDLGYTKAYILTTLKSDDIETFISESHEVEGGGMKVIADMSKRETEAAVKEYKSRKGYAGRKNNSSSNNSTNPTEPEKTDPVKNFNTKLSSLYDLLGDVVGSLSELEGDWVTYKKLCDSLCEHLNNNSSQLTSRMNELTPSDGDDEEKRDIA